ncbi:Nn.00g112190.m01.CDS01 [Neocucurbitaria sp. VM-36]
MHDAVAIAESQMRIEKEHREQTLYGACERCQRNGQVCRFEPAKSPLTHIDPDTIDQSQNSPTPSFQTDEPEGFMWPRLLSRLRESFLLDRSTDPFQSSRGVQPNTTHLRSLQPDQIQKLQKAANAFPPQSLARFLLSICNEHGTDSFFYFNQTQLQNEIDEFYANPNSELRQDIGFICLAHAVFALGSQWATMVAPEVNGIALHPGDEDPGRIFHQQARALVPDIIELNCIRSIQATYVIGVYLLPASAFGSSYLYLGLALRKALALGLHREVEAADVDDTEKELRRRLWWAVYSLERCTTVKLNRPRSLDASIIAVRFPTAYSPLDSQQIVNNIDHQIANAQLMMILDRAEEPTTAADALPVEKALKAWKHSLPPNLRLQNIPPNSSSYRATFHLHLNYYFTRIAIGKVSLVTIVRSHLRCHFGEKAQTSKITRQAYALAQSCIKAAQKILQLFEDVRLTGNLTRFSFTDFQGCSISTTIVLLAGIIERDASYERHVRFGLDSLRKMAVGNGTATAGVAFVEGLQTIADEAVEKLGRMEGSPSAAASTPKATKYAEWVEWLSRQSQNPNGGEVEPRQEVDASAGQHFDVRKLSVKCTVYDAANTSQQLLVSTPTTQLPRTQDRADSDLLYDFNPAFVTSQHNEDSMNFMSLTGFDMLGLDFQTQ